MNSASGTTSLSLFPDGASFQPKLLMSLSTVLLIASFEISMRKFVQFVDTVYPLAASLRCRDIVALKIVLDFQTCFRRRFSS
jgi:hypothetical protein